MCDFLSHPRLIGPCSTYIARGFGPPRGECGAAPAARDSQCSAYDVVDSTINCDTDQVAGSRDVSVFKESCVIDENNVGNDFPPHI
jgi:hypothetical protein